MTRKGPPDRGGEGPGKDRRDLRRAVDRAVARAGKPDDKRPRAPRPGKRPPLRLLTTTLWEYPSQHYDAPAGAMQGDKAYTGATPSWVIWQLLQRYTREGDTVLDPMCGSGTTIDVAKDLARRAIGFDLAPTRDDIARADARELPVDNGVADLVFVDPPYSTHVDYSDDPACIGKLDAGEASDMDGVPVMGAAYYEAMEEVIAELHRVLRRGGHGGLYVSDSWKKKRGKREGTFMPIGFELFAALRDYFTPVDIVCVARHNTKLERGNWHQAAERENFFLRGFNYLFIFRKDDR